MNSTLKTSLAALAFSSVAILLLTPQYAQANGTAVWGGTTGTFTEGCEFKSSTAGVMSLTGNTWTVTTPASVKVKTRKVPSVTVESDDILRRAGVAVTTAVVNYTSSTVTGNVVSKTNGTSITVGNTSGNGAKVFTINIDGTAVMADTDDLISATAYTINHTVTCNQ